MKKGIPISEVCLQLNIERSLVLTWGWEAEINVIKKDWDFLKKEAISLMSERVSVNEVARRLAIPRTTVSSWRKKAGITVNSQSAKMKSEMYGAASWYEPPPPIKRKPQKTQSSGNSGWATSGKKEKALTMLREGTSQKEVRRRLGVNNKSLKKWMKEAGLTAKSGRAKNRPHHSTTPHSPEIKEKALQMIRDGATLREVEGRLKISYHTIYGWMRKAGLSATRESSAAYSPEIKEKALQMIRDGATLREVEAKLSIPYGAIAAWARKAGLSATKPPSHQAHAPEIKEEALQMVRDGAPIREVEKKMKISYKTIHKWARKAGLSATKDYTSNRPQYYTPEIKEKALQMIRGGATLKEVEAKLSIPYGTIYAWARKAGLTRRYRPRRKTSRPRRKTSPLKEEGLQMIRDGISGAEVARRLGVHEGTVRKWRKAAGLSGKSRQLPGRKTPELKEEGLQMIRDGISGAEVARRLGVHKGTVSNWRKSAGLSGVDGREYHSVEQENDVIDLLRDGKSQAEISRIIGVSGTTIRKWKKRAQEEGFL